MVALTRIYTRGGDGGETSLGDGSRRAKNDLRIEAYGTVDEANAILGLVRLHVEADLDAQLSRIQNDLFDLGADLCTPEESRRSNGALRMTRPQVEKLEQIIDFYNESLAPLTSFILPGGTSAAAYFHHARTVIRRAERLVVALGDQEKINPEGIKYLNRLSDLMFVLSRHCNGQGAQDILWVPGGNR